MGEKDFPWGRQKTTKQHVPAALMRHYVRRTANRSYSKTQKSRVAKNNDVERGPALQRAGRRAPRRLAVHARRASRLEGGLLLAVRYAQRLVARRLEAAAPGEGAGERAPRRGRGQARPCALGCRAPTVTAPTAATAWAHGDGRPGCLAAPGDPPQKPGAEVA
jgi:hypothetical protein